MAAYKMDPHVGQSPDVLLFSLCSTLFPCISFIQEKFLVKILRRVDGSVVQPGAVPILWIMSLQLLSPLCWVFQLMSSPLGPESLLLSWNQFPIPTATHLLSISWPSLLSHLSPFNFSPLSPFTPVPVPLFPPPHSPSQIPLPLYLLWQFCSHF